MPQNDIATPVDPGMAAVVNQSSPDVPTPDTASDTGVLAEQPGQEEGSVEGPDGPAESDASEGGMLPSSIITPHGYIGDSKD